MSRAVPFLLVILVFAMPPVSAWETDDTVFVRISSDALVQAQQAGLRPVRVLDYASFAWVELAKGELSRLQAAGLPYELQTDPYCLRLGEQSFDPLRDGLQLPSGWASAADAPVTRDTEPDLYLIQLAGPIQAPWLAALGTAGLELVSYVHPYSYIVWGDSFALARAAGHDFVRWTGAFEPAFRLDPRWRSLGEAPVRVNVLLYRGSDLGQVAGRLAQLGGEPAVHATLDPVLALASLELPAPALQAAAHIPGVYSIQVAPTDGGPRGELTNQVNVNNLNSSGYAVPGYREWLAGAGLDGSGVVIANVDEGVRETHLDLAGRMLPCTGQTCSSEMSSHGTHTAGIMAADGSSGIADSRGFLRGLGMAPGANLVEQLFSPWSTSPEGMRLLMTESYRNGASISGNSWGSASTPQGYDPYTREVDIGVRDADPEVPGNQALTYVLSIMNGFGGTSSQGAPDEAKNTFTVGSTYLQYSDGLQRPNIDDLSLNTGHGPALDGRKIPHMVAPGYWVDSTGSYSDSYHLLIGGTSMASPQVSGAAALFVQHFRAWRAADPSPAMIKAAFLAVGHDLAGHKDADGYLLGHPFDSKQGWGRLDVAAVLDPQVPVLYFDQLNVLDNTGQVWQQELLVADNSRPLRLMLVWTDSPGHGLGVADLTLPAWNNDLDLVVEAGGQAYLGNAFGADGWSVAGGSADGKNNTEGVFLPAGAATPFTVRVVASNISSDGIPNQGDITDQDFALVCYNCLPLSGPPRLTYLPLVEN